MVRVSSCVLLGQVDILLGVFAVVRASALYDTGCCEYCQF